MSIRSKLIKLLLYIIKNLIKIRVLIVYYNQNQTFLWVSFLFLIDIEIEKSEY